MLVGERMTKPAITIRPETSMPDALDLMRKEHIRRLPVVDKRGQLVGDRNRGGPSQSPLHPKPPALAFMRSPTC